MVDWTLIQNSIASRKLSNVFSGGVSMHFRSHAIYILLSVIFVASPARGQGIVQVIPLPNTSYWNAAWGFVADSTHLYIASNSSDALNGRKIVTIDTSGNFIDSVLAPSGVVSNQGLSRDSDGNFYFVRRYTARVTILKLSPSGTLLDSIALPSSTYIGGVAWDGSHVWYSVYFPNDEAGLYKLNFTTKSVEDTILVPTRQPYGVTWDGVSLYYVENGFDNDARGIFKVDPVSGDTTGFIPEPVDGTPNGTSPRDLAWDGRYMWLLAEPVGASTGRALYKYDLGAGGTPDIGLGAPMIDFGGIRVSLAETLSVSLLNSGTADLRIDSVVLPGSSRFASLLGTPVTVAANSAISLPVVFSPLVFGPDSAVAEIHSNDPDEGTVALLVRGLGIFGSGVISAPPAHDFSERRIHSSTLWRFKIENLGGGLLTISSFSNAHPDFRVDSLDLPIVFDSLGSVTVTVWFNPSSAGTAVDTLTILSDASNGPITAVVLEGAVNAAPVPIGQPLWQYTVPDHPVSNTFRLVKAVRAMNDITGDGKPEIIISTENYWTMAVNGNASESTDSLWAFSTYISSYSAGSIGSAGDYSHQKALAVASDLNRDGHNDVVIGTGGGNEHVYAINGRTGGMLWTFGTDHPDSFGLGDITAVDVQRDFNGDGIPDVVAAAAATQSGGVGGRRSMYLFNGETGSILWQSPLLGFTHGVASVQDLNSDNVPDAVGTVGEPSYKMVAFNGANGVPLWEFPVPSASGGAKEVMEYPVQGQTSDIILGAFWGPVYRIDGVTGTQMWTHVTGGVGGGGVMQMARLKDVTGDGVDEVLIALLGNGAQCLDGATGTVVWALPTDNTMGITALPDLNNDGVDDVGIAVQQQGALVVKGQNGQQLTLFPTGSNQAREIGTVPDMDNNDSWEIIFGGRLGNVGLISGGLDAATGVVEDEPLPDEFGLGQNYPNPFNPSTTIEIQLPHQSDFTLTIFDMLGRRIKTYSYEHVSAGTHSVVWYGSTDEGMLVSSGVYFYTMRAGEFMSTRKLLLLR